MNNGVINFEEGINEYRFINVTSYDKWIITNNENEYYLTLLLPFLFYRNKKKEYKYYITYIYIYDHSKVDK